MLIYTANYGTYDTVLPQAEQDVDVDWLCITDDPHYEAPAPWRTLAVPPAHQHPNLAAKVHKAQPPWQLGDWTHAIWIDANMEITDTGFARNAIPYVHDGVAAWQHPRRDCVYDEAAASIGPESQGDRYANLPITEQMAAYRAEGYPAHAGLYATGTLVWTPDGAPFGKAWITECEQWGFQDQLCFPVVAWRLGIVPGVFGVHQVERRYSPRVSARARAQGVPHYLGNRWLRIHPHTREPYL